MVYAIECIPCREAGRRRIYWGESSRSAYQRGREHDKEISDGVLTHPLTIHSNEEHEGTQQPYLMRIVSKHRKAMDRQVTESVRIELEGEDGSQCLNFKSEWGAQRSLT